MGSSTPKVLLPVSGRPILSYVIDAVRAAGCGRIIAVVGAGREQVMDRFADAGVSFVVQQHQRGTADALLACRGQVEDGEECAVVYGDVPLMTGPTIRRMVEERGRLGADVAVLTAVLAQPFGYGRVLRSSEGWIERIVEERDADEATRSVREVNSGFYAFRWGRLLPAVEQVKPSPVTGEYYLTDAVRQVAAEGGRVAAVLMDDPLEMSGVNTPEQFRQVEELLTRRERGGQ
jgi:bifunctional UDP-N-acetylglucosamine pyrophosphorylase/glucosamine-1-phosphate N-acetyltransferase